MLVNVGVCKATAEITGFTGLHNSDGNSHHSRYMKLQFLISLEYFERSCLRNLSHTLICLYFARKIRNRCSTFFETCKNIWKYRI